MTDRMRAVAFDVDGPTLAALHEALPGWDIEVINGVTSQRAAHDWDPGPMDLLIVTARGDLTETWGLCRLLLGSALFSRDLAGDVVHRDRLRRSPEKRSPGADVPLVVLVPDGNESMVRATLEAGADGCLIVPMQPKEMIRTLAHVRRGNQSGRHTLNLNRAQRQDRWRDDGGQG